MNPRRRLLLPISIFLTVFFGLHAYLWMRLVHDTGVPEPFFALASVAIVLLGASAPLGFFMRISALQRVVYLWMGAGFLTCSALIAMDLLRLLTFLAGAAGLTHFAIGWPLEPRGSALIALGVGLALIALALVEGLRPPRIRKLDVPALGHAATLSGLTIVQLSDVHIGPTRGRAFLSSIVERVNELSPDLVVITGDLVDGSVETMGDELLPLRELRARLGVAYVPGNHEHYHGGAAWIAHVASLGIRVLLNAGTLLGEGAQEFFLAGVDDPASRRTDRTGGPDLARALHLRPTGSPTILLSHQPIGFETAVASGVNLQLSGHTHGGQIFPFGWLVALRYPFVAGLYRLGESHLYVSRGTGFWGPPMRLAAPSEITALALRAA
jgi:predicted MPP superfamily phosphohydrolase